ncbi:conserved hypothetical protein [Burkholderia vietnamiensis G4]|uniref:Uncharacterized protein n=2 Tax=Burkholderiaceae TaxID=119060 RepID=A4JRA7_BURVG|nr:conserved hypothetical protein [Burkholderia vietnamiensis G4]
MFFGRHRSRSRSPAASGSIRPHPPPVRSSLDIRIMTPIKFVLRYTAIPFVAIVAVVLWAVVPSSKEIDARQYAALSRGYANFPLPLRHEISESMADGRISDGRYQALVRDSLGNGVALDWPASGVGDVAAERQKLAELLKADPGLEDHRQ